MHAVRAVYGVHADHDLRLQAFRFFFFAHKSSCCPHSPCCPLPVQTVGVTLGGTVSGSSSGSMGEAHPLMVGAEKVTAKDNHRMSHWIQVTLHCINMTRMTMAANLKGSTCNGT